MEKIKEYYHKNPNSTVALGETSRSDQLDEERHKSYGLIFRELANFSTRGRLYNNYYEQPRMAAGHTAQNVSTTFNL